MKAEIENDGTPIVFEGSPLHNELRHGRSPKATAKWSKLAFKARPNSQFWYDANEFIKENNL